MRDVGTGVVVASIGSGLANDLGFSTAFAQQGTERLTFGKLEPLVSLVQETPAARLIPLIVDPMRGGTSLRDVSPPQSSPMLAHLAGKYCFFVR